MMAASITSLIEKKNSGKMYFNRLLKRTIGVAKKNIKFQSYFNEKLLKLSTNLLGFKINHKTKHSLAIAGLISIPVIYSLENNSSPIEKEIDKLKNSISEIRNRYSSIIDLPKLSIWKDNSTLCIHITINDRMNILELLSYLDMVRSKINSLE